MRIAAVVEVRIAAVVVVTDDQGSIDGYLGFRDGEGEVCWGETDGDGCHQGDGHQGSHHGYGEVVLGSPSDAAAARRRDNATRGAHTTCNAPSIDCHVLYDACSDLVE